jgi:TonB family protein
LLPLYAEPEFQGYEERQNVKLAKTANDRERLGRVLNQGKEAFPHAQNLPGSSEIINKDYEPLKVLKMILPTYPKGLRALGKEGKVAFYVLISEEGKIEDALLTESSDDRFIDAAWASLKEWGFSPARVDGKPCKATVVVPIKFRLAD